MSGDPQEYQDQVHRRDVRRVIRLVLLALVVIAAVVVASDNRDDVRLGYVAGDTSAPLWLVIVGALAVGVVIGWLVRLRRRH